MIGSLTLEIFLSFTRLELEVTAERNREKVAASRQKGIWMGGRVPLVDRIEAKKLLADDQEAGTSRTIG